MAAAHRTFRGAVGEAVLGHVAGVVTEVVDSGTARWNGSSPMELQLSCDGQSETLSQGGAHHATSGDQLVHMHRVEQIDARIVRAIPGVAKAVKYNSPP